MVQDVDIGDARFPQDRFDLGHAVARLVLGVEQRPHHAVQYIGVGLVQETDPVLFQLPVVERRYHGGERFRLHAQHGAEEFYRCPHRIGPRLPIGATTRREISIRREQLEGASGQELLQDRAALRAPLVEHMVARRIVFLPAKQRLAAGCSEGPEHIAHIGQERIGRRQFFRCDFEVAPGKRRRHEGLGKLVGIRESLRQLIGAVEKVRQRERRILGEHVRLQMRAQLGERIARDAPRRNGIARPHEYGRGNEQHVVRFFRGANAPRLGARFDQVGEGIVGGKTFPVHEIECRFEHGVFLVFQEAVDARGETVFPIAVLDPAARSAQSLGKARQAVGIAGMPAAAGETGAFHDSDSSAGWFLGAAWRNAAGRRIDYSTNSAQGQSALHQGPRHIPHARFDMRCE